MNDLPYQTTESLTLEMMEAAHFARMADENLRFSEGAFANIDAVLAEHTGVGLMTMKEARAKYDLGKEVLKDYVVSQGRRSIFAEYNAEGERQSEKPVAWYVTFSGYLATSPAYRTVRLYPRRPK